MLQFNLSWCITDASSFCSWLAFYNDQTKQYQLESVLYVSEAPSADDYGEEEDSDWDNLIKVCFNATRGDKTH